MKQADDFFRYSRERHNVYLLRRNGEPYPWTDDRVINTTGFTNIYRELDRVTIWFRQHIRDRLRDQREVVPATIMFRWFNRITTGEVLEQWMFGQSHIPVFEAAVVEAMIRKALPKGPWVTGSYMMHSPYGVDKLKGMLQYCEAMWDWWGSTGQYLFFNDDGERLLNMEGAHKELVKLDGLSGFTGYEVVTDLRYTSAVKINDRRTWAHAGPGATRGGSRVMYGRPDIWSQGNRAHQAELRVLMKDLLSMSRSDRYWPQNDPDWPEWEMREVEHTLCEFDKYERVRREQGQAKRVFNPAKAGPLADAGLGGL